MTLPNLDAALYSKLANTAAITALVSTRIYNLQAETGAAYPYIVFNLASGLPDNSTAHQDMNSVYRIAAVAATPELAYPIIAAVHDALHMQPIAISGGWTNFWIAQEGLNILVENLEGTQIYRVVAEFRIRASLS